MILDDYQIKVRMIVETVDISKEYVYHILTEKLGIRKLTANLVSRFLTVDQKHIRMNISKALLEWFKQIFLCRLITVDETYIHYFTFETKEQSKQWIAKGEPVPKKVKTVSSDGKATVF